MASDDADDRKPAEPSFDPRTWRGSQFAPGQAAAGPADPAPTPGEAAPQPGAVPIPRNPETSFDPKTWAAGPPKLPPRSAPAAPSRRGLVVALGAGGVIALGGGAWWWLRRGQSPAAPHLAALADHLELVDPAAGFDHHGP